MISFNFDINRQEEYYDLVKKKLKTQFYQKLGFYILPYMPEKFRNRVVFLPEICDPIKIYKKHKIEIDKLESSWLKNKNNFVKKLKKFFPKIGSVNILISPQLYGTLGSYHFEKNKAIIRPRYDRKIVGLESLIINCLTHFFYFDPKDSLDNFTTTWTAKQSKADEIVSKIVKRKSKSMTQILDTEFAGKLAEESAIYFKKLNASMKNNVKTPINLTKFENALFNILLQNKNRIVSFEKISDALWGENASEKYSEYAITKLVERLKTKLPKNLIHPQRGLGYVMYSPFL